MGQFFGLEHDSDEEMQYDDQSDAEYQSDDDTPRTVIDYDIEKMFDIIQKRDFNGWSLKTIHHHYKKIKEGETGRKQLSR